MKSAYVVLGVPGNAGIDDIEQAYAKALSHFSKERLLANPDLSKSLDEVKEAYKVLASADLRKAHDRKLSSAVAPPIRMVAVDEPEKSTSMTLLKWMAILVVAMFATGTYFAHMREVQRKERAAQELALKKAEEEEAVRVEKELQQAQLARERERAIADSQERQLRAESVHAARQAQVVETSQQYLRARQEDAGRAQAREDDRQRAYASQQRAAEDQRRIRNLCMLNYGRPNC